MMLDPSIILQGQAPDVIGAMQRGNALAAQVTQQRQANMLAQTYRDHGAGIMAGEQGAMNALAGIDPGAAMQVQGQRLDMDRTRLGMDATRQDMRAQQQNMGFDAEKMQMLREQGRREAQDFLSRQGSAAAKAQAEDEARKLMGLAPIFASGDRAKYDAFARANGIDIPFDNFLSAAAMADGVMDVVKVFDPPSEMDALSLEEQRLKVGAMRNPQPDWRAATPEEAAARGSATGGQINAKTGEFKPAPTKSGLSITSTPDGGFSFAQGEGVTGGIGSTVKPGTAPAGYNLINDPAAPGGVRSVATPGGPAERENAEMARKRDLAVADYERKFNLVDNRLDAAISSVESNGRLVSGWGAKLKDVPETQAKNLATTLETIKANLGFEELQNMRDNSPTGGALGQVTERELAYLQAIQGSLDQEQSSEQLLATLRDIKARRAEFSAERRRIMAGQGQVAPTNAAPVVVDGYTIEQVD